MTNFTRNGTDFSALLTMFESGYDTAMEINRLQIEHSKQVPSTIFLFGSGVNVVLGMYAFFGLAGPLFGISTVTSFWTHVVAGIAAVAGALYLHRRENRFRARIDEEYTNRMTDYYVDEFEATLKDLRAVEGDFTEDAR